jgi:hypothetical protein
MLIKRAILLTIAIILLSCTPFPMIAFLVLLHINGYELLGPISSEAQILWHEMIEKFDLHYLYDLPGIILNVSIVVSLIICGILILVVFLKMHRAFQKRYPA